MKKKIAMLLALMMVLSLAACGESEAPMTVSTPAPAAEPVEVPAAPAEAPAAPELVDLPAEPDPLTETADAAIEEGDLVIYGSCSEEYLAAACANFEAIYGIKTVYKCLSADEAQKKIAEENGAPSADVWFGGNAVQYADCAAKGLFEPYEADNTVNLSSPSDRDADGMWYGISEKVLGFIVNTDELTRLELEAPQSWEDLRKTEYKGLIALPGFGSTDSGKLLLNTMIRLFGQDEGCKFLAELDKSVAGYAASDAALIESVAGGECVIGVGFLSDGIAQMLDKNAENLSLIIPTDGTCRELAATAILKGAPHPAAAKLWTEFALTSDCVDQAQFCGSYEFPVLTTATQPQAVQDFALDLENVLALDLADVAQNTDAYFLALTDALKAAGADMGRLS